MKQFFSNPITITAIIIIIALIGYNYWGWFGGKEKNKIVTPKEGDKCHVYNIMDAVADFIGSPPLDGIIQNGICIKA